MSERFHTIEAEGARLTLDLAVGHVRSFEVDRDGRVLRPLHTAPWVDDPAIAADPEIPGNLKYLSGDFFCAPFGKSDVEAAPPHGWPPNSPWTVIAVDRSRGAVTARYELTKRVMDARLVKEVTLRDGHPFAYQRHVFHGGSGKISVASHAMTRLPAGGRLSFSPKAFAELPSIQQETDPTRGRSVFAHPARFTDLSKMPLADGRTADLHVYPIDAGHEDFAMLVEAEDSPLGWATAVRPDTRDIMVSLKSRADFPVTFLWFSNGGRYYAPWNRRHIAVLGIEEGRAWSAYGHAASIAPNPLSDAGIPTSLTLVPDGSVAVRHVFGGLPLPDGWTEVTSVSRTGERLRVTGSDGTSVEYPYDAAFLAT